MKTKKSVELGYERTKSWYFGIIIWMVFMLGLAYLASNPKLPLTCMKHVEISTAGSTSIYTIQEIDGSNCK